MADHQAPRTYRRASAGPVAVLCVVGAVLVGSAACSTGQPASGTPSSGQPAAGLVDPPISGSASLESVPRAAKRPRCRWTADRLRHGALLRRRCAPGHRFRSGRHGRQLQWTSATCSRPADGTVFGFGDARFHGSIVTRIKDHVAAIVETNNGGGYWLACVQRPGLQLR